MSTFTNIFFYNNYHNGDVFYSKEFVRDIKNKLVANNYYYIHNNDFSILKDFNIPQIRTVTPDNSLSLSKKGNDLYINTWVGQGGGKYLTYGCSLKSNYLIFLNIYKTLGIDIEPIGFYIPTVNYDKIEQNSLYTIKMKKSALVCNNYVHSGQSDNFNFDPIIDHVSNTFPNVTFILTNDTQLSKKNIIKAKNIIGFDNGNLLEISNISTKTDIIIGRASGPFCFAHIQDNMKDPNKTFISFSYQENESKWVPDEESQAKQFWFDKFDNQSVIDSIESIIKNKYIDE